MGFDIRDGPANTLDRIDNIAIAEVPANGIDFEQLVMARAVKGNHLARRRREGVRDGYDL